jgi:hypothetical protein
MSSDIYIRSILIDDSGELTASIMISLMIEAISSSEMSHSISVDSHLHTRRSENLKSQKMLSTFCLMPKQSQFSSRWLRNIFSSLPFFTVTHYLRAKFLCHVLPDILDRPQSF